MVPTSTLMLRPVRLLELRCAWALYGPSAGGVNQGNRLRKAFHTRLAHPRRDAGARCPTPYGAGRSPPPSDVVRLPLSSDDGRRPEEPVAGSRSRKPVTPGLPRPSAPG